jgi:hypothetical protein
MRAYAASTRLYGSGSPISRPTVSRPTPSNLRIAATSPSSGGTKAERTSLERSSKSTTAFGAQPTCGGPDAVDLRDRDVRVAVDDPPGVGHAGGDLQGFVLGGAQGQVLRRVESERADPARPHVEQVLDGRDRTVEVTARRVVRPDDLLPERVGERVGEHAG